MPGSNCTSSCMAAAAPAQLFQKQAMYGRARTAQCAMTAVWHRWHMCRTGAGLVAHRDAQRHQHYSAGGTVLLMGQSQGSANKLRSLQACLLATSHGVQERILLLAKPANS